MSYFCNIVLVSQPPNFQFFLFNQNFRVLVGGQIFISNFLVTQFKDVLKVNFLNAFGGPKDFLNSIKQVTNEVQTQKDMQKEYMLLLG